MNVTFQTLSALWGILMLCIGLYHVSYSSTAFCVLVAVIVILVFELNDARRAEEIYYNDQLFWLRCLNEFKKEHLALLEKENTQQSKEIVMSAKPPIVVDTSAGAAGTAGAQV